MKVLMILLTMLLLVFPEKLDADNTKTLKDLIDELNVLENKFKEKDLTEEKIKELESNIIKIGLDIDNVEKNIINIKESIDSLNDKIDKKNEETKKMLNLFQLSNSGNIYLEYALGAASFTDLIFRYAVIEQLTEYNGKMIKQINEMIEDKKNKSNTLNLEKERLERRKQDLLNEQLELGERMNFLDEDLRTLEEEIKDARRTIDNYRELGCKNSDILEICSKIPSSNTFLRPLSQGYVTSPYGIRVNPLSGKINDYVWHYAIDIGGNKTGTPVYSVASGRVVLVNLAQTPLIPNSSCGGNYVVIQHNINGEYYATRYAHLSEVFVTENQIVDINTVIGSVGGGELYDRCSTGPHLDFSMARGIYAKDFFYFREPYTVNPASIIDFPPMSVWFSKRYE